MNCKISNAQREELLVTALSDESQANAARLIQAMTAVFTGSPSKPISIVGMGLGATFDGGKAQFEGLCRRQLALGYSQLYIILDPENPFGPPIRFDFIYADALCAIHFDDCAIWSPPSGNNTMIAVNTDKPTFFRFKPGHPFALHETKLPSSLALGNRRAMNRFYENLAKLPAPDTQNFMLLINV